MNEQELYDAIDDYLYDISDEDAIELWNNYCLAISDEDSIIHSMYEFDELVEDLNITPTSLIEIVLASNFSTIFDYFTYDATREEFSSFSDLFADGPYDRNSLIRAIIGDDNDFGNSEIRSILDSSEGEEY